MTPDHYQVLGLAHRRHDPDLSHRVVKSAFRKALLSHHPDKNAASTNNTAAVYSVDQITTAYHILSHPTRRAEYQVATRQAHRQQDEASYLCGLETADLDDLDQHESHWSRSCRCGAEKGFVVLEADLESAAREGEVLTSCTGCSLWLRVLFAAVDHDTTAI